jgi:hypothetical protein
MVHLRVALLENRKAAVVFLIAFPSCAVRVVGPKFHPLEAGAPRL